MIFGYLMLFIAVTISAVAAYYSVAGLTAIFSAAVLPVIIMGGALEAGKIAGTVWLHNNWKRAGYIYKAYLIPAIMFLMLLTSMGIFGFLSKAHNDQALVSGDVQSKIAIYDEKIRTSKDNIDANRKALKQMDEAVDQVMGRSSDEKGADKAVGLRKAQQKERVRLQSEIQAEQKTVATLNEQAAPIRAEVRKVEAEVGPVKYIAAFIYGANPEESMLEKAVTWVIILIVVVFDPLALCLILAANKQLEWARSGKGNWVHDEEETAVEEKALVVEPQLPAAPTPPPSPAATNEILDYGAAPTPLDEEAEEAEENRKIEQFFVRGKLIARGLDADEAARTASEANMLLAEVEPEPIDVELLADELSETEAKARADEEAIAALAAEYDRMADHLHIVERLRNELQDELNTAQNALSANIAIKEQLESTITSKQGEIDAGTGDRANLVAVVTAMDHENGQLKAWVNQLQGDLQAAIQIAHDKGQELIELQQRITAPAEVEVAEVIEPVEVAPEFQGNATIATFGTEFPKTPNKGDLFLRVDYNPERLFKWNMTKWIEIDRSQTDRFAFDTAYVQHLVEKIQRGEYSLDDLNEVERAQVGEYLQGRNA